MNSKKARIKYFCSIDGFFSISYNFLLNNFIPWKKQNKNFRLNTKNSCLEFKNTNFRNLKFNSKNVKIKIFYEKYNRRQAEDVIGKFFFPVPTGGSAQFLLLLQFFNVLKVVRKFNLQLSPKTTETLEQIN